VARRLVLNKGPLKDGFDRPDGVLLFLHGAQVADGVDDCEGDILAAVRAIVAIPTMPVAPTKTSVPPPSSGWRLASWLS